MLCREALLRCTVAGFLGFALIGCRSPRSSVPVCDPDYAAIEAALATSSTSTALEPGDVALAPELAGPQPVETYVHYALGANPEIFAARQRVEAETMRVPQAAALQDPMLEVNPFLDPMHMGDMRQVIDMGVSQQIPWRGKRGTRAAAAEQEAERARAELAATELAVIEQVKVAYYELYFIQQAIQVTEADRELLNGLQAIASARFGVGEVTQQDVLRAELEILELDNQLVQLNQQLTSARARLARQLHLSPETPLRALEDLPEEQIPQDVARLYDQAVAARPELHAQLADIMQQRHNVDLARLEYFPDVRLSGMWMGMDRPNAPPGGSSGGSAVKLGIGVNLPIYRQRLDAGLREAEARVVASARQYDSLRDQTREEVADLFAQVQSQQELLRLLREEIVPKADQTFEVSLRAYEVGDVTFLQLVDNWRQLLRFQISAYRLESQLRQSLARLERVVGGVWGAEWEMEWEPEAQPAAQPEEAA